jgi:hypothetical protein
MNTYIYTYLYIHYLLSSNLKGFSQKLPRKTLHTSEYIYIYIYILIHLSIYFYKYIYIYTYLYIHYLLSSNLKEFSQKLPRKTLHTSEYIYIHIYTYISIHIHLWIHIYIYTYLYMYYLLSSNLKGFYQKLPRKTLHTSEYIGIHMHTYLSIHIHLWIHTYIYIYVHICTHIHIYIYIYIYIYICILYILPIILQSQRIFPKTP